MGLEDQSELNQWLQTAQIIQVFNRYFRSLDEKHFDGSYFQQIFTNDAQIVRPNGAVTIGPDAIAQSHRESFAHFISSQHLLNGHDVTITDNTASIRANLVAIHLWKDKPKDAGMLERSFSAGGVITADLLHTPDGWRITRMDNQVLWRLGSGFQTMLQMFKDKSA
jgi:SnoaL-like domain